MAHPWLIWVIAVVTGICHAKQAAMADYYRQFHLYFLKGEDGSELETASDLKAKLKNLSWSHDFWKKLTRPYIPTIPFSKRRQPRRCRPSAAS